MENAIQTRLCRTDRFLVFGDFCLPADNAAVQRALETSQFVKCDTKEFMSQRVVTRIRTQLTTKSAGNCRLLQGKKSVPCCQRNWNIQRFTLRHVCNPPSVSDYVIDRRRNSAMQPASVTRHCPHWHWCLFSVVWHLDIFNVFRVICVLVFV